MIDHLIKTNVFRKWDIYILGAGQEMADAEGADELDREIQDDFIRILQFAYLQVFPFGNQVGSQQ